MTRKGNNPATETLDFETQSGTSLSACGRYHGQGSRHNALQPCGTADDIRDKTNSRGFPTGTYYCWAIVRDHFFLFSWAVNKPDKGQEER